jgi:hypothetical protein
VKLAKRFVCVVALRALVADTRARNLLLPALMERHLETLDEDESVPLDGVTPLPDGMYQVDVRVSRAAYGHLLEIATLMDKASVAHDATTIIETALGPALEAYRGQR